MLECIMTYVQCHACSALLWRAWQSAPPIDTQGDREGHRRARAVLDHSLDSPRDFPPLHGPRPPVEDKHTARLVQRHEAGSPHKMDRAGAPKTRRREKDQRVRRTTALELHIQTRLAPGSATGTAHTRGMMKSHRQATVLRGLQGPLLGPERETLLGTVQGAVRGETRSLVI